MEAFVPLFQSLSWIALIVLAGWRYKTQVAKIVDAIQKRIEHGSSFKAGPIELGQDLKALEHIPQGHAPAAISPTDWSEERDAIYKNNHGIFLAHVIEPSREAGQLYDIFIYLIGHKSRTLEDVEAAEFFLGSYWGNEVFRETHENGLIGMSTTAYGPFLCTCRVTLKDGTKIRLNRYIDFEMGRVYMPKG
jgi:hypothetical protein